MRIGEFLVSKGVIDKHQVEQILRHSRLTGLRFGEAALDLRILSKERLVEVFGPNWPVDFFHIEAAFFPPSTRSLFSADEIIRYGAVPLAFKRESRLFKTHKLLNVGFLDPGRQESNDFVRQVIGTRLAGQEVEGFKSYLILADQLIELLQGVFGVSFEDLRARGSGELDPTLSMFVESTPS